MKASTARRMAWSIGILSIALLIAGLVIMFVDRHVVLPQVSDSWTFSSVFDVVVSIGVPAIGLVIASRRRENPLGWLLLAAGLALGLVTFSRAYALHSLVGDPGSWPAGRAFAWLSNWIWTIPISLLPFLLLLFPTGRLPVGRWRPVAWFCGAVLVLLAASALVVASTNWSRPFADVTSAGSSAVAGPAIVALFIAAFALQVAMLLSFVALWRRFARSRGDERLQLKWFVTAAAFVAITFIVTFFTNTVIGQVLFDLALVFLYAAIGIAILKYRLYEIDVLINRAVVYGGLAAFITAVYVLLVAVVGAFIGATEGLALVATAVVAVAFQPMRARAQGIANRLVYGKRATPYEVLSEFSERVAETYAIEDVLPRMARILAEGTGAIRTEVWLRVGSELRPAASWPEGGTNTSPVAITGDALPTITSASRVAAATSVAQVRHQGVLLGALTVIKPPLEPLTPAEEKLLADLASQAGLVLRNVSLLSDLRASRQRLVAAQDEARRRLERNLHDGAQQQLVALSVKQRLVGDLIDKDPDKATSMIAELQEDTAEALDTLRDLARGIYPQVLADQGLPAALQAQIRRTPVPVDLLPDSIGRHAQEIEAAVYFCCLEALQNVSKYANASKALVRLAEDGPWLTFGVEDDGAGFDPAQTKLGTGLQGMSDRLEALGGGLEIRSEPGRGTTIAGRVPTEL
jgi:signal transduction histidine kinase